MLQRQDDLREAATEVAAVNVHVRRFHISLCWIVSNCLMQFPCWNSGGPNASAVAEDVFRIQGVLVGTLPLVHVDA